MKKVFLLLWMISWAAESGAQKQITTQSQIWVGYINQIRLNKKWSVTADAHLRTRDHLVSGLSTSVLRAGIIYHLNETVNLSAGYAFFNYYPADDHKHVAQPERRPYQQVQWQTATSRLRFQQRIRLEERFRRKIINDYELEDSYNFNFRARCQLLLFYPLKAKSSVNHFSLYGGDEVLLNFGKRIIYNTLDHNRIHLGVIYHPDKDDQLQVGYLNIFQQQSSGNRYKTIHVIRIYYTHALDLRKKS